MATATLPATTTDLPPPPPPTTSTASIPSNSQPILNPPVRPLSLGSTPGRTHSARIVGLSDMSSEVRAAKTTMQTITIPGVGKPTYRRSAVDFTSGLSAYVVKAGEDAKANLLSVTLKTATGLLSTTLKGHKNEIVDIEFLRSGDYGKTYTLGSCDKDGVVYLWFLKRMMEGGKETLGLLRYYSFYSLRKSKFAYFTRIRLAGTVQKGVMVLCPNDGSSVRVIQFRCLPNKEVGEGGEGGVPVIMGAKSTENVEREDESEESEEGVSTREKAMLGGGLAGAAAGTGAAAAAGLRRDDADSASDSVEDAESLEDEAETGDYVEEEERDMPPAGRALNSSYVEPHTEPLPGRTDIAGVVGAGNPSRVDTGYSEATTSTTELEPEKNKTYPLTQDEFGDVEVDDDIAAATAQAAGIEQDEDARAGDVEGEYEQDDDYVEYGEDDEYQDARGSDSEYQDEYEDQIGAGRSEGVPMQSRTA